MNGFDLESKLKCLRVPERTEEYWQDFPAQVRRQLHRPRPELPMRPILRPQFAWAGGLSLALALTIVGIQLQPLQAMSLAIAKQEQQLRLHLARLDAGLHLLMFNPHGMGYLLTEPS